MSELVSVIVPTYNRAYCLARAIDSALGQTHEALEVIVIDDGSSDGTPDLIRSRYANDPRVRYSYQENAGVSAARNHALDIARGDYVAFLDSDDIWRPWKTELQLAALRRRPDIGMVWSDMEALAPDGTLVSERYLHRMYTAYRWFSTDDLFADSVPLRDLMDLPDGIGANERFHVGDIFSPMVAGNLVHTSTVVLRRDRLEKVGRFDRRLVKGGEDYDFHLRTCREGPVGFCDVATISYQTGQPDRLTQYKGDMAQSFLDTVTGALERDRDRITLPPWLLRETLAMAHAWVAETRVAGGDPQTARRHFLASLRQKPWQPRAYAQLLVGLMPAPVDRATRLAYERIKRLAI